MNTALKSLKPYPFERLQALYQGITPAQKVISLSVGEPQHAMPDFVQTTISHSINQLAHYPITSGSEALRRCIANWLTTRFHLKGIDAASQVLSCNGSREALFATANALFDRKQGGYVLMPDPLYQIYRGAALLAGGKPYYLRCDAENHFIPNYDEIPRSILEQTQLLYICSPGNPTGAVHTQEQLQSLIEMAQHYGFLIAADECYSEIYFEPQQAPPGLLQAATMMGNEQFEHCLVFNSLSKRSNLPGLRSGLIAGDAKLIEHLRLYRTYQGAAMSPLTQAISIAAWSDETHVQKNRSLYGEKFTKILPMLAEVVEVTQPDASFYLWPKVPSDEEKFTRKLYQQQGVAVLPGRYLSATDGAEAAGAKHVRLALVAELSDCIQAAERIQTFCQQNF